MGNLSTKHLDTQSSCGTRIRHGSLKLEYKKIVELMGEIDEWQRCKPKTGCTFYGSGYEWLLTDATYAARNTQMNWVVYSHLAVETIGGTAHHLIKNMMAIRMDMEHRTFCVSAIMGMLWRKNNKFFEGQVVKLLYYTRVQHSTVHK